MTTPLLDIAKLYRVKKVISHTYGAMACADGLASAMIIKDALPNAQFAFMNYNTKEHDELPAEEGLLFVDFTPPKKRVQEFVDAGAIVLDHHDKARPVVEAFPEGQRVFADEKVDRGVSGALLAYRHVWRPLTKGIIDTSYSRLKQDAIRHFAIIAGIRDTWMKEHPSWRIACAQAEVLKFYPPEMWMSRPTFDPEWIAEKMEVGNFLLEKAEARTKHIFDSAATFVSQKGTGFAIVPTTETSDVSELFPPEVKFIIGFSYSARNGFALTLSMRSRGGYDVGEFCLALSGGGHSQAAGAKLAMTMGDLNPYAEIKKLVDDYERGVYGEVPL